MKKLFVLTAAMAMVFASCKKYEVSKPLDLESLPKIKITGNVYAQLDETKPSGEYDLVPQSKLVVRVSVPYSDYDANNASGGFYVFPATVIADGTYEVEVPYVSTGVNATVSFLDFTYDVKKQNNLGEVRTVLKHFKCGEKTVHLGSGQSEGYRINIDVTYSVNTDEVNSDVLKPTYTVQLTGRLEYHEKDTGTPKTAFYKPIPAGREITATIVLTAPDTARTYKEVKSIKTTSGGEYTIDVPMVKGGTANVKITGEAYFEFLDTTTARSMWFHKIEVSALTTSGITVYDYSGDAQQVQNGEAGAKPGDPHRYTRKTKLYDIP
jgi:hypothetical protein